MMPTSRSAQANLFMSEMIKLSYTARAVSPQKRSNHLRSNQYMSEDQSNNDENKTSPTQNYYTNNRLMFPVTTSVEIPPEIISKPTEVVPIVLKFAEMDRFSSEASPPTKKVKRCKTRPPDENIYNKIISIAKDVHDLYGTGYTERVYQEGMYFSAYKIGIPCLMERNVFVTHDETPILIGRVDLEVASRFVFELKIHAFNESNLKKDTLHIEKYLRAYAMNKHIIDRAALIYFNGNGVRVVEIEPFFLLDNE